MKNSLEGLKGRFELAEESANLRIRPEKFLSMKNRKNEER